MQILKIPMAIANKFMFNAEFRCKYYWFNKRVKWKYIYYMIMDGNTTYKYVLYPGNNPSVIQ